MAPDSYVPQDAPVGALPIVPQPLAQKWVAAHATGGAPTNLAYDVVGLIVEYLTQDEREVLRGHGMLLDWTRLGCATKCGCTPGCNHPAEWQYERIAQLASFRRVGARRAMVWRFDPPIYISDASIKAAATAANAAAQQPLLRHTVRAGYYVSITVDMTDDATVLRATTQYREDVMDTPQADADRSTLIWECPGASYHFLSLFVRGGFDVTVAKNVDMSGHSRQVSDLRLLHYELLVAKKENGFAYPLAADSGEWPPALLFDTVCSGSACLCCQKKQPSRHWAKSLRERLNHARVNIVAGAEIVDLNSVGLSLTTPGTRASLSQLNQDADILAQVVEWGAVGFLQKVVDSEVDFFSRRQKGCPVYFLSSLLAALGRYLAGVGGDAADAARIVRLTLRIVHPRDGRYHLTPACLSRGESLEEVTDTLAAFVRTLPPDHLATVATHHLHLAAADGTCMWCAVLDLLRGARSTSCEAPAADPPAGGTGGAFTDDRTRA